MLQGLSHKAERFAGCEYGFSRVRAIIIIFFLLYHVSGNLLISLHLFGWQLLLSLAAHLPFLKPSLLGIPAGSRTQSTQPGPFTPPGAPQPPPHAQGVRWSLGRAEKAFGAAWTRVGRSPSPPCHHTPLAWRQPSAPLALCPTAGDQSSVPGPLAPTCPHEETS